jgi:hypothetical protein
MTNTINSSGLLEPQILHVKTLVDSLYINGFAVDTSETGCGKMYCASAIAREMNVSVVVISPKAVIPAWESVVKLFNLKPKAIVNFEKLSRGSTRWMKWKKLKDPSTLKVNAITEIPVFSFPQNSLVIVDEGHKCKGANTSNSWMLIALKLQGYRVLVSSATVACSPLEMKAFGYLTNMHKLYNFNDFCRIHGAKWVGRFGLMSWDMISKEATESMMALHNYLYQTTKCTSRMTVDMFGKIFPESHIVADAFDLGANQKKLQSVYDEMEYELAQLEEKSKGYSEHIFAVMMKARRLAELCKVPLFAEKARELYDEGKSVCIFVNFEDSVGGIFKRLTDTWKIPAEEIGFVVGGQRDSDRKADITGFNADTKRILIINIAAGGTGISLHDLNGKHARASIISPNWSAQNLRQALGRIWRLNGLTKSYQIIVYGAKTIEENICRRVQAKLNCLDTLNDGDLAEHLELL